MGEVADMGRKCEGAVLWSRPEPDFFAGAGASDKAPASG